MSCSADALLDWGRRADTTCLQITSPAVAELDVLRHFSSHSAGQNQQGIGGDVALACSTELQDDTSQVETQVAEFTAFISWDQQTWDSSR